MADTLKEVVKKVSPDAPVAPDYSPAEYAYISLLLNRMLNARDVRENSHDEFDGMTYIQRCEWNRKSSNTFIMPKKNKEDTTFVTGVTRNRMVQLHSYINNMNLTPQVAAWSEHDLKDMEMGLSLDHIVEKTLNDESDEQKLFNRQWQILEQGEVFLQEVWEEGTVNLKRFVDGHKFDGTNIKNTKWIVHRKKKDGRPVHNILQNENVFLGDITIFDINDQPFIFTVEQLPYTLLEEEFGDWERWKCVSHDVKYFSSIEQPIGTTYNNNWSLTQLQKDHGEKIIFRDRFANEVAIVINGILMTPVGLPMPNVYGEEPQYDIVMQTLGAISPFFAYGKSIPMLIRTKQILTDEFWRLMLLKTQKSFLPAYANNTGVQLSNRIFMPGKMTTGIDGDKIKRLDPDGATGVSRNELMVVQQLQAGIDDDTTQGLTGKPQQGTGSRTTATQSRQMESKAELMLVLIVFSMSLLEKKLGEARLWNILGNWFKPLEDQIIKTGDIKTELKKRYRKVNLEKNIEGEGPGQSIIRVGKPQDAMSVFREEEDIKNKTGVPTRIRTIDPEVVESGKWTFKIRVDQKQKKSSDIAKIMFGQEMQEAVTFFPDTLNKEYMQEEFAIIHGHNPMKMFKKAQQQPGADGQPAPAGQPASGIQMPGSAGSRGSLTPKSMTEAGKPPTPTPSLAQ